MSATDFDQIPFGTDASVFAENPENRCPCLLLLDTSGSMQGLPIQELNAGLTQFKDELLADSMAAKRVEVAVVTFGPVRVATEFTTPDQFFPEVLQAGGDTPMGAAILKSLEMIEQRKATYRQNGVAYYRPWVFLITDGAPTDDWSHAAAMVREGQASKKFEFFAVGVKNANFGILEQISTREPLGLDGLRFRDLFKWLSNSIGAVARSTPGDSVPVPAPTWTSVG